MNKFQILRSFEQSWQMGISSQFQLFSWKYGWVYGNGNFLVKSRRLGKKQLEMLGGKYWFCSTSKPPKLSHFHKILSYLNSLKDQEITNKNIQLIAQQILTSSLQKSQRSSATKYLMSILFKTNYPLNELLTNVSIKSLQKDQQFIELQTIIHVINKQMLKQNPNLKYINDLYLQCFNRILPNVADHHQKIKCQAVLLKNFGKYAIHCGIKSKGVEALEKSVTVHQELLLEEHQKLKQMLDKKEQQPQKSDANKQKQQLTIKVKMENIRKLTESMFQVLYFYYCQKIPQIKSELSPQKKQQIIASVSTLINSSIKMRALLTGIQIYSKYYHKLAQIYYELEYGYAMLKKNWDKAKDILKYMKEFEGQCLNDIVLAKDLPQAQKEIATVIFGIQLHLSRVSRGKNVQAIKEDLSEIGLKIIEKDEVKEKEVFTKLLADFMKKNLLQVSK